MGGTRRHARRCGGGHQRAQSIFSQCATSNGWRSLLENLVARRAATLSEDSTKIHLRFSEDAVGWAKLELHSAEEAHIRNLPALDPQPVPLEDAGAGA